MNKGIFLKIIFFYLVLKNTYIYIYIYIHIFFYPNILFPRFSNFSDMLFDKKSPVHDVPGLGQLHRQNQPRADIPSFRRNQPIGPGQSIKLFFFKSFFTKQSGQDVKIVSNMLITMIICLLFLLLLLQPFVINAWFR